LSMFEMGAGLGIRRQAGSYANRTNKNAPR
jgi:hypothetical protein